jgi:hypothetical protein
MDSTITPVSMTNGSEVTWKIALTFWWAWFWRTLLGAVGGGFVLGFIAGIVGSVLGVNVASITNFAQVLGGIFGIAVGVYFMKMLLNKDFKTFKISIVRK